MFGHWGISNKKIQLKNDKKKEQYIAVVKTKIKYRNISHGK